jgi:hypothetical protein
MVSVIGPLSGFYLALVPFLTSYDLAALGRTTRVDYAWTQEHFHWCATRHPPVPTRSGLGITTSHCDTCLCPTSETSILSLARRDGDAPSHRLDASYVHQSAVERIADFLRLMRSTVIHKNCESVEMQFKIREPALQCPWGCHLFISTADPHFVNSQFCGTKYWNAVYNPFDPDASVSTQASWVWNLIVHGNNQLWVQMFSDMLLLAPFETLWNQLLL